MTGNENRKGISLLNRTGWTVNASTGIITLTEQALQQLINPDPIEKWYIIDQEPLARGQFAVVYHCCHKITGIEYAAKFSSRWRFGTDCIEELLHEIAVCALLESQAHAVQLIDVFSTATEIVLVMEYAPGGDLQTLLDEELVPYEHDVILFIRQLLDILVVIHDKNLVHLDIKPQNLVLMGEFPECEVKLCDFEISRMLTKDHEIREILGTPDYVAPEILHYEPITVSTDMWSVGVLTYVLLTGFLPFGGDNDQETFLEISRCELDFPSQLFEDITPEAIDFIRKLLIRQPELRMSAKESLMHSWIRSNMKRPPPPHDFNLANMNIPTVKIDASNISNIAHNGAERSLSCPLSDNSDKPEDKQNENSTLQNSRPTLWPSDTLKSFNESNSVIAMQTSTNGKITSSNFSQKIDNRNSRQNLERLKSLSKSREVLSGKIQMSNLKKCQSKSREQIMEAKFGFSKSHEQLMALRSLSQSVEALSALSSRLQQANNLCSSCNNIFTKNDRLNIREEQRMYQSLASIDQIDNSKKLLKNQYDSTVSLNTEIYNDLLTKRNTDINCKLDVYYENPKQFLRLKSAVHKGGRDKCGVKCTPHNKTAETDSSQRTNRSERKKQDIIKKKETKESVKTNRIREKRRKSLIKTENNCIPKRVEKSSSCPISVIPIRRGSVSHVEQRIQERHEREQERKQKENNSIRRRSTSDYERRSTRVKSKSDKSSDKMVSPRSKNMRQGVKRSKTSESAFNSDVSQASSLESVEEPINRPEISVTPDLFVVPTVTITKDYEPISTIKACNEVKLKLSSDILSEYDLNGNVEINNSIDDVNLLSLSKQEIHENSNISVSERIQTFEKVSKTSAVCKTLQFCSNIKNHNNFTVAQRLGIINEEDSMSDKSDSKLELSRTTSSSSDVGSVSSSNSDIGIVCSKSREIDSFDSESSSEWSNLNMRNKEASHLRSVNIDIENFVIKANPTFTNKFSTYEIKKCTDGNMKHLGKGRSRSFSIHSTVCDTPKMIGRSRSKSFNCNNPIGMPWGSICSGAIARAFEKFNLTQIHISPSLSPQNNSILSSTETN